jgi:endonuclease G
LFNRHYVLGYSYYFRQAKWALEIVDRSQTQLQRADNFRPDYRVPEMFRADLADYEHSGYDRGHLVPSADKTETNLQNSETFLLSNMSPQKPEFNRDIWKKLEDAVRQLDAQKKVFETYVISGPIFNFDVPVATMGSEDANGVTLPIPHAYFKSVLAETDKGALQMWSFMLPNEASDKPLEDFLVPTVKVERYAGLFLWQRLMGKNVDKEKSTIRKMWKYA